MTRHRRGAAIIIILVVFAVTMTLAAVWTRRILSENRAQRLSAERAQARWLAEAGVRRAAARLVASADYDGEDWLISAADLNLRHPASVLIRVEPDDSGDRVRLVARARYPQAKVRVQVTKTVFFTPPNREQAP
jgi:type II secretory pathway component PulK